MYISSKMIGYGLQFFGRDQELAVDLLEAFYYALYYEQDDNICKNKAFTLLKLYLGLQDEYVFSDVKVAIAKIDLIFFRDHSHIYESILSKVPERSALSLTGTAYLPSYDPRRDKYEFPLEEFYYSACGAVAFGLINAAFSPFKDIVARNLYDYCQDVLGEIYVNSHTSDPQDVLRAFVHLFERISLLRVDSGSANQIDVAFDRCFLELNLSIDFNGSFWSQPFSEMFKNNDVSASDKEKRQYFIHLFFLTFHACAACPHSKRSHSNLKRLFKDIPSAIIDDKSVFKVFSIFIKYMKEVFSTSDTEWVKIIYTRSIVSDTYRREGYQFTPYLESQWNLTNADKLPDEWIKYKYIDSNHNLYREDIATGRWLYILKMYGEWDPDFEDTSYLDIDSIAPDIDGDDLEDYLSRGGPFKILAGGIDPAEIEGTSYIDENGEWRVNENYPDKNWDGDVKGQSGNDLVLLKKKKPSPKKALITGAIALSCAALIFSFYRYRRKKGSIRK